MKKIIFFFVIICALIVEFHRTLQDGRFLRYLDEHPNPLVVPTVEYYVAGGYYVFHDLDNAATYYARVPERYPQSPLADDAYWEYLQTLEDNPASTHTTLLAEYLKYVEHFPKSQHLRDAQNKIDSYKVDAR